MKYALVGDIELFHRGNKTGFLEPKGFHEEFDASGNTEAIKKAKSILKRVSSQFPAPAPYGDIVLKEGTVTLYAVQSVWRGEVKSKKEVSGARRPKVIGSILTEGAS